MTFTRRRTPLAILALLIGAGTSGCFQMEYGLTLERDLSGEAEMAVTIDLEQLAVAMATLQRSMSGAEGPPTEEEIGAARAELMEEVDDGSFDEENLRGEIEPDLPEGVRLLDARSRQEGLRSSFDIRLGFDHLSRLDELDVGPDEAGGAGEPFGGLELVDEGDTFIIRNEPVNPIHDAREGAGPMMEGVDELMETMFRDLRIAFTLDAPFEVVEHNATERTGTRLSWVYDYETMSAGAPQSIFVRYRK